MKRLAIILYLFLFTQSQFAQALPWNLPARLNDGNTKLTIQINSTTREVTHIAGNLGLTDSQDPSTLSGAITFTEFPKVAVEIVRANMSCTPQNVTMRRACKGSLHTKIRVGDFNLELALPVLVERRNEDFIVSGTHSLRWPFPAADNQLTLTSVSTSDVNLLYRVELRSQAAPHS